MLLRRSLTFADINHGGEHNLSTVGEDGHHPDLDGNPRSVLPQARKLMRHRRSVGVGAGEGALALHYVRRR